MNAQRMVQHEARAGSSGGRWTPRYLRAVVALLAVGCADDAGRVASPNTPPTASAGTDQDVTRGSMVMLVGSATDPDGQSLTLTWSQVSGPGVGPLTGPMPTFAAPNEVRTLEFELVASDGRDSSAADRVVVRVLEDAAHALWVAPVGDDANPGTRASPKLTIQAAIDAASDGADVYVAAGTYAQSATITLRAGVSLYGGFHPTTFLRDPPANETVITGASTAISGTGANALTIDGLTIRSADGLTTGPEANRSSVGIAFQNSDDVIVTRNRILTGNGIAGAGGTLPPFPETGGHGGLAAGSSGGSGGSGVRPGGNGGDGGGSFAGVCTSGGTAGGSGLGPSGGTAGPGNDTDGNGVNGGHGGAGINGLNATGSAQSFGSAAAGAYVPAPGGNGGPGTDGSSGGGGGGGDCLVVGFLTTVNGGGGGGGGGAGAARGGSGGGRGGGASIGILVTGQSTGLFIADNVIITGDGGTGGQGTSGSLGSGGGGGSPGARLAANGTLGGHGGDGGHGGGGGAGGGGGGGPTIGVVVDASSATNLSSADLAGNAITLGMAGQGGLGGFGTNERFAPSGAPGLRVELAVNP